MADVSEYFGSEADSERESISPPRSNQHDEVSQKKMLRRIVFTREIFTFGKGMEAFVRLTNTLE
jgi:hypothetical protein